MDMDAAVSWARCRTSCRSGPRTRRETQHDQLVACVLHNGHGKDIRQVLSSEECESATTTTKQRSQICPICRWCKTFSTNFREKELTIQLSALAQETVWSTAVVSGFFMTKEIEMMKKDRDFDDYGLPKEAVDLLVKWSVPESSPMSSSRFARVLES